MTSKSGIINFRMKAYNVLIENWESGKVWYPCILWLLFSTKYTSLKFQELILIYRTFVFVPSRRVNTQIWIFSKKAITLCTLKRIGLAFFQQMSTHTFRTDRSLHRALVWHMIETWTFETSTNIDCIPYFAIVCSNLPPVTRLL